MTILSLIFFFIISRYIYVCEISKEHPRHSNDIYSIIFVKKHKKKINLKAPKQLTTEITAANFQITFCPKYIILSSKTKGQIAQILIRRHIGSSLFANSTSFFFFFLYLKG